MRTLTDFLKKNWLILLLALAFVVYVITNDKKGNVENETFMSAPELSTMVTPELKAAATPAGTVTFCFRLDGREDMHLPALMGNEAQSIYPNGLSGYNWSLNPSASGQEDYGVLPDGTIFAKEDFLQKWGMTSYVEIKSDKGGWQPLKMERVDLDGEIAYVY